MAKGYSSIYDAQYTMFNTRYRSINNNTFKCSARQCNPVHGRNTQTNDNSTIIINEPEHMSTWVSVHGPTVRLSQALCASHHAKAVLGT